MHIISRIYHRTSQKVNKLCYKLKVDALLDRITHKHKILALGVDPGIANTGLAVAERSLSEYRLSSWGLVKSTPKVPKAERVQA